MATRNCKHCGKEFDTDKNSQTYCSVKCRKLERRKNARVEHAQTLPGICAFCGAKFTGDRKKKYCCDDCRIRHNKRLKPKPRNKPAQSIADINALARAEGLSYGQYVAKYGYGKEC